MNANNAPSCDPMNAPELDSTLAPLIALCAARMREGNVDSVAIFRSGIIRLTGRWGCTTFPDTEALSVWLTTGKLPESAQTKFTAFNPTTPN